MARVFIDGVLQTTPYRYVLSESENSTNFTLPFAKLDYYKFARCVANNTLYISNTNSGTVYRLDNGNRWVQLPSSAAYVNDDTDNNPIMLSYKNYLCIVNVYGRKRTGSIPAGDKRKYDGYGISVKLIDEDNNIVASGTKVYNSNHNFFDTVTNQSTSVRGDSLNSAAAMVLNDEIIITHTDYETWTYNTDYHHTDSNYNVGIRIKFREDNEGNILDLDSYSDFTDFSLDNIISDSTATNYYVYDGKICCVSNGTRRFYNRSMSLVTTSNCPTITKDNYTTFNTQVMFLDSLNREHYVGYFTGDSNHTLYDYVYNLSTGGNATIFAQLPINGKIAAMSEVDGCLYYMGGAETNGNNTASNQCYKLPMTGKVTGWYQPNEFDDSVVLYTLTKESIS